MISDIIKNVLGTLTMSPHFLDLDIVELNESLFSSDRERQIFRIIARIWENDRPDEIPLAVIHAEFTSVEDRLYIDTLRDGLPKSTPANFRLCCREHRRHQLSEKILRAAESQSREHLKTGIFDEAGLAEIRTLIDKQTELRQKPDISAALKKGSVLQELDLQIEYTIAKLLPEQAMIILHGCGGLGKTWIGLHAAKNVDEAQEFFGLQTKKCPVIYIDFENTLPILVERARKLDIRDVFFWHQSFEPKPPKLDSDDYVLYKTLPPRSLLIFDSLRSAHDLDENDSKDMALVMGRLKEIRDSGFTILAIHHTPRANDRASKGSTAITDLADHVLSLYRVRRNTFEKIDDDLEPSPDDYFRLGTGEKTRFEHHQIFLKQSATGPFLLAEDPDQEHLDAIFDFVRGSDHALTQTEIFAWAKAELEITKKGRLVNLLRKGEKKRWISTKSGNRRTYASMV